MLCKAETQNGRKATSGAPHQVLSVFSASLASLCASSTCVFSQQRRSCWLHLFLCSSASRLPPPRVRFALSSLHCTFVTTLDLPHNIVPSSSSQQCSCLKSVLIALAMQALHLVVLPLVPVSTCTCHTVSNRSQLPQTTDPTSLPQSRLSLPHLPATCHSVLHLPSDRITSQLPKAQPLGRGPLQSDVRSLQLLRLTHRWLFPRICPTSVAFLSTACGGRSFRRDARSVAASSTDRVI